MSYSQQETDDAVQLLPSQTAIGSVIWLHGLGADGHDFIPIVEELDLPARLALRFIFPHAEHRPVSVNNGYTMRAWYDIKALSLNAPEDAAGIRRSQERIARLIETEAGLGIPPERVLLAGFSQGGAIALQTALRNPQRLGGVMALSTYLPLRDSLAAEGAEANKHLPILMCHGLHDPVLPIVLGTLSRDRLRELGYTVDWHEYPMQHQVCLEEVTDIAAWMSARYA